MKTRLALTARLALALAAPVFSLSIVLRAEAGYFTNTGALNVARNRHTATLLVDGRVLVVGGSVSSWQVSTPEIYDPLTGMWTNTGVLNIAGSDYTATLLANGQVLFAGDSVKLYNSTAGTWTNTGAMNTPRSGHTATLLPNSRVLVAGGNDSGTAIRSAEIYDPHTGTWTNTGSVITARYDHTATLLLNGKLLVAGGSAGYRVGSTADCELYDSISGAWIGGRF